VVVFDRSRRHGVDALGAFGRVNAITIRMRFEVEVGSPGWVREVLNVSATALANMRGFRVLKSEL
jgi:hypothetical protein